MRTRKVVKPTAFDDDLFSYKKRENEEDLEEDDDEDFA